MFSMSGNELIKFFNKTVSLREIAWNSNSTTGI